MASSNSWSLSQPRRVTHSSRSSAMCVGGPPNPMHPIRPHSRTTTLRPGRFNFACALLGGGRLEELDRVAGGIVEQDLLPAGAADDVVAEAEACGAQALDLGGDVA